MRHLKIQVKLDWQLNWYDVWKLGGGGTPHIPIWDIWSDVRIMAGTLHKVLEKSQEVSNQYIKALGAIIFSAGVGGGASEVPLP